jgi:MEMO1 family protein
MKRAIIYLILILIILTALSQHGELPMSQPSEAPTTEPADLRLSTTEFPNIKCTIYDEKSFRRSVSHGTTTILDNQVIKGGITPHHLLADDFIASFFKTVSVKNPELVFIIAPNHKNIGNNKISTCYSNWETPFGLLYADFEIVKSLVLEEKAGINSALMETDHSIAALIPYVKYFMPNAKLVPIMLQGDTSMEICTTLGNTIAKLSSNKNSLILASVDFSHYLPLEEADKMDEITLNAINTRNLKQIRSMGNDNMDSPPSIITLLSAMNAIGADKLKVLGHSNSDRIANSDTGYTTSYFTMVFGK